MVLKVTTGWDRSCWRAEGVGCIALDLLLPLFFVVRLEYFYLHLGKIFVQHAMVRRFHYLGYKQRFLGGAPRAESVRHDRASFLYFVF